MWSSTRSDQKKRWRRKKEKETFRLHTLPCHHSKYCFLFLFLSKLMRFLNKTTRVLDPCKNDFDIILSNDVDTLSTRPTADVVSRDLSFSSIIEHFFSSYSDQLSPPTNSTASSASPNTSNASTNASKRNTKTQRSNECIYIFCSKMSR